MKIFDDYVINSDLMSQEAYFGKDSPLSLILIKYVKKLKTMFTKDKKIEEYNDKVFISNLKSVSDNFGIELANELNMEKITFVVTPDFKEENANSFGLTAFENTEIYKDDKQEYEYVSLKKYIDLENIVCTKTGYKFKNKKNKLGLIKITAAMLINNETEVVAAFLCHEIGHMFQQGVFGSYKYYSDMMMANDIKRLQTYTEKESSNMPFFTQIFTTGSLIYKLLKSLISYILFPKAITTGLFSKVGLFLYKNIFHRIVDEKTFLMKDKVRYNSDDLKNTKDAKEIYAITKEYAAYSKLDRDKFIQNDKDSSYDEYKNLKKEEQSKLTPFGKLRAYLMKYIAIISLDLDNRQTNWIEFITMSNYTQKVYRDNVYYQKYEYFADIFASSYGFAKSIYKGLIKYDKQNDDMFDDFYNTGFYKIPFINVCTKMHTYTRVREIYLRNEHGTTDQRGTAIYTDLMNELQTNPDLTIEQKKSITEQLKSIKSADDEYINDKRKNSGFLYKWYNKIIDHRINGYDKTVEDKILNPIKEVCMEED